MARPALAALSLMLLVTTAAASGPDSAPTATPAPAARRGRQPAPKPAPFFAGPVYVLSAAEGFLILDPGDGEEGGGGAQAAHRPPPPPGGGGGAADDAATIILLDGVSNFTAFFEDGRDLLDGSGDGGPGRAVFTALFARDGLPRHGAGGADLRGTAAGASSPGRLSLTSVRLAQYDPAARQLVLTANAPATAGRRAVPGALPLPRPGGGLSLRGVALTFQAAPRGGPAAASDEKPEGAAAARAAAAALKAARAAGWGATAGAAPAAPAAAAAVQQQPSRRPAPRSGRDLPPSSGGGGGGAGGGNGAVAVASADEGPR